VRTGVIAGVVFVVVAAVGGTAYAMSHRTTGSYRTATVTRGPVTQTLLLSGNVGPSVQSTVAFPASGTVATVPVRQGQVVAAGAVLATQDAAALTNQITQDEAGVASAKLTLYQAQTGQASSTSSFAAGSSSSGSGHSGTGSSGSSGQSAGSGASHGSTAAIKAAQSRLLATQRKVDASLAKTQADLTKAGTVCGTGSPPGPGGPHGQAERAAAGSSSGASAGSTTGPSASPTPSPSSNSAACAAALKTVLADESSTLGLQRALGQQESALDKLLQAGSSGTSGGSGSSASAAANSSSGVASAQQLAADQAEVDAAEAQLAVAEQNLAQATIASPIAGTVEAVNLSVGQQVGANSGSANVVVTGGDGHVVTTSVDVTDVTSVKVGESATVTADGSPIVHTGSVIAVGIAPTSTSSSSYPVTIGITDNGVGLRNGVSATVNLVVAHAVSTMVVPTSAVHTVGALRFVTVMAADGSQTVTRVTVGAVGPLYTQVSGGTLAVGDQVVLANLSTPLPTNSTFTRIGGGLGGFGGGVTRFRGTGTATGGTGATRVGGGAGGTGG
jgi:multidrug efflux pump subunit AcrA (membrane-fusion protein)